jgi:hypothetical protein
MREPLRHRRARPAGRGPQGPGGPPWSPWRCMRCDGPLAEFDVVLAFNANASLGPIGGHPREPTPEPPPPPARVTVAETMQELARATPNVDFGCFHQECNPYAELHPYEMPVVSSAEEWMHWCLHLAAKKWMGRNDLRRLLAFYWEGRREIPPGPS